jgi:acetyl-CoA carboxylase carboxyl transferase subunit alpha
MAVCDELAMLENAIYSVISPRGFASILWKDPTREKEAANILKITAEDLMGFGVCEKVIKEPLGGAHNDPEFTAENLSEYLLGAIEKFSQKDIDTLLKNRYNKFRKIGVFTE